MNRDLLLEHFDRISAAPDAVPRLRQFILDLAVRGKLVGQNPNDEPATDSLRRIHAERASLLKDGRIRSEKPLAPICVEEMPFAIPKSWLWVRIGQASLFTDYGTSHQSAHTQLGVPVLKMGDIQDGRVVLGGQKKVPASIDDLPSLYLQRYDLLYNRTNSAELVGKTGIYLGQDREYTFASYLIRIRCSSNGSDPKFINLAMNAPCFRATQIVPNLKQQCGQANVNGTILKGMLIPFPPVAEQRRIVAKVDELMALCDQLEEAQVCRERRRVQLRTASIHSLTSGSQGTCTRSAEIFLNHLPRLLARSADVEKARQAILNLAIRGLLVGQDPTDEPASSFLGTRCTAPNNPPWQLPAGWAWSSLGLIGKTLGGGTPSKADHSLWEGPIPWVSPKDMKVELIHDSTDHISELALECSAAQLIPKHSLLLVVRGMILAHSFPTAINDVPVAINQDMKAVVPFRSDLVDILLLLTKGLKPDVLRLVQRSTHGTCKLLTEDLFSLPIPIPPLSEQKRIIAKVNELMALCNDLQEQLEGSTAISMVLRDSVLAAALVDTISDLSEHVHSARTGAHETPNVSVTPVN